MRGGGREFVQSSRGLLGCKSLVFYLNLLTGLRWTTIPGTEGVRVKGETRGKSQGRTLDTPLSHGLWTISTYRRKRRGVPPNSVRPVFQLSLTADYTEKLLMVPRPSDRKNPPTGSIIKSLNKNFLVSDRSQNDKVFPTETHRSFLH